jgi:type VI secretion system VasD/TssJ family lipoprotein
MRLSLFVILLATLSCSLIPLRTNKPVKVQVQIIAANINLDAQGKPHSTVVTFYPLLKLEKFKETDPLSIISNSAQLEKDLAGKDLHEEVMLPNQEKRLELLVPKEVAYVGIIAGYIRPDNENATKVYFPLKKKKDITLRLLENSVSLELKK